MSDIFLQMAILFIIIAVGFLSHKSKIQYTDFDRALSRFIINISCPALVLSSVMGENLPDPDLVVPLGIVGIASYALVMLISIPGSRLFTRNKADLGVYSFMLVFGNVGFIGYPVVAALFGHESIFFAAVLNFTNSLFIFSLGMFFVSGGQQKLQFDYKFLINPIMIASYLSILIVCFEIKDFPIILSEPLKMIGSITVPGALLIIGSSIAQIPLKKMCGNIGIYAMCAMRLLFLPFIVYGLTLLLTDSKTIITVNTVLFAMPVATLGTMFCLINKRDDSLVTQGIFISTIASMLTIPCVYALVNHLNDLLGI
ncbi:AEC family transporter [Succinatimonas hippei]|uniref:AEC family transporter n=1 Tax=Succinatimonas hippei TaxID=626938 RepID=UPI002011867A|nr:AEC family transporter [Succinatimonas hippei]MCL1604268.1 AEC family transporter [Succinatimonas hippei]